MPPKTYRITYERNTVQYTTIEVDAESLEQAERKSRSLVTIERARRGTWRTSADHEDPEMSEVEEL